jgi:hypothetical protein
MSCDKCGKPTDALEDEYGEIICQSCRDNMDEAAYERQQERDMDDSQYRRDMIDAGRGHLVK